MGDDVVRLASISALARRRWRVLVLFALVGAVVGFGASVVLSPGYSASSKILLRGQPDDNQLLTEAQIAKSLTVLDRVAADLQWGKSGVDLQSQVTASILDGNVLEVTGLASTPDRARELTDHVAATYVTASTQIGNDTKKAVDDAAKQRRDSAQKRVDDLGNQLAQAQSPKAPPEVAAQAAQLGTAFTAAQSDLTEIDREAAQREEQPSSSTTASVLEPALDGGAAPPSRLQLVLGGALGAALLALYLLLRSRRRGGPLGDVEQVSAALGAPVVASVVVSMQAATTAAKDDDAGDGAEGGPPVERRGLGRLFADDPTESTVELDPHPSGEVIRYRRALARVGAGADGAFRLLVLVPRGDRAARAAVAELAAVAAAVRGPAQVITDDVAGAEVYRELIAPGHRIEVAALSSLPSDPARTVLRVAAVSPSRPTVPDDHPGSGVLVVLGAWTRTTSELVDIASACFDGNRPVLGAMVVTVGRPVVPSGPPSGRPRRPATGSSAADSLVRSS